MTDVEVIRTAEKLIAASDKEGGIAVLLGLPMDWDTSKDPTMSSMTMNRCTTCGDPVRSTVIKDTILFLTKDRPEDKRAALICIKCLMKIKKADAEKVPEDRTIMVARRMSEVINPKPEDGKVPDTEAGRAESHPLPGSDL